MKTALILFIGCLIMVAGGILGYWVNKPDPPDQVTVSYFDWRGNYHGCATFDSIWRYPDSTVYFFKSRRFTEPAHLYFYCPDLKTGKEY